VWHYLRDHTFSLFHTMPECDRHTHTQTDRQTDRHTTTAYTALSIASRGKNDFRYIVINLPTREHLTYCKSPTYNLSYMMNTMQRFCGVNFATLAPLSSRTYLLKTLEMTATSEKRQCGEAGIPRRRHRYRHGLPREEIARIGRKDV